jgi:hypothetical protein
MIKNICSAGMVKERVIYTLFIPFFRNYYEMQDLHITFANAFKENLFSFFCNVSPTKTVYLLLLFRI